MAPPVFIDASDDFWAGVESGASIHMKREFDAIYAANVLHFSTISVAKGIVKGAGRMLTPEGRLFLYSPFSVDVRAPERVWRQERRMPRARAPCPHGRPHTCALSPRTPAHTARICGSGPSRADALLVIV